jgi:hypothetical protein
MQRCAPTVVAYSLDTRAVIFCTDARWSTYHECDATKLRIGSVSVTPALTRATSPFIASTHRARFTIVVPHRSDDEDEDIPVAAPSASSGSASARRSAAILAGDDDEDDEEDDEAAAATEALRAETEEMRKRSQQRTMLVSRLQAHCG